MICVHAECPLSHQLSKLPKKKEYKYEIKFNEGVDKSIFNIIYSINKLKEEEMASSKLKSKKRRHRRRRSQSVVRGGRSVEPGSGSVKPVSVASGSGSVEPGIVASRSVEPVSVASGSGSVKPVSVASGSVASGSVATDGSYILEDLGGIWENVFGNKSAKKPTHLLRDVVGLVEDVNSVGENSLNKIVAEIDPTDDRNESNAVPKPMNPIKTSSGGSRHLKRGTRKGRKRKGR